MTIEPGAQIMARTCAFFALMVLLSLVGCGSGGRDPSQKETVPTSGTVRLATGGVPKGAQVLFHPVADDGKGVKAQGTVGDDGSFVLTTYRTGDGAPEGEYAVTVVWTEPAKSDGGRLGPDESEAAKPNKLHARYSQTATSGIRRTVKKGTATLEPIELK
jgi:hypothetical protein